MKTSGHLSNNGGIRGHSAGVFFPLIVVATGCDDSAHGIRWHVQGADGKQLSVKFYCCSTAHDAAAHYFSIGVFTNDYT